MRIYIYFIIIFFFTSCHPIPIGKQANDNNKQVVASCEGEHILRASPKTRFHAEFPGGDSELEKFIKTSERPQELSAEANNPLIMNVGILINKEGKIDTNNISIGGAYRPLCGGCISEAKRLIDIMPDWIPAYDLDSTGRKTFIDDEIIIEITF